MVEKTLNIAKCIGFVIASIVISGIIRSPISLYSTVNCPATERWFEKNPETYVSNHPTTSNSGIYESSTDSISEGVIYEKDSPETKVSNHPTTSTGVCATSSLSSTEGVTYEAKKSKINTSLNIKDKKEDINESVNEIKSKMRDILQATVYTGSGRKAILKCNLARAMFYLLSETKTETKGSMVNSISHLISVIDWSSIQGRCK